MRERVRIAQALHGRGYNCCQAVLCAYADTDDIDEKTLFKIGEGFGAGMGNMNGICGALSAAIIIAGLRISAGEIALPPTKAETYEISALINESFKEKVGSLRCRDIKGTDTGVPLRSCSGCIEDAVNIIDEVLFG